MQKEGSGGGGKLDVIFVVPNSGRVGRGEEVGGLVLQWEGVGVGEEVPLKVKGPLEVEEVVGALLLVKGEVVGTPILLEEGPLEMEEVVGGLLLVEGEVVGTPLLMEEGPLEMKEVVGGLLLVEGEVVVAPLLVENPLEEVVGALLLVVVEAPLLVEKGEVQA